MVCSRECTYLEVTCDILPCYLRYQSCYWTTRIYKCKIMCSLTSYWGVREICWRSILLYLYVTITFLSLSFNLLLILFYKVMFLFLFIFSLRFLFYSLVFSFVTYFNPLLIISLINFTHLFLSLPKSSNSTFLFHFLSHTCHLFSSFI